MTHPLLKLKQSTAVCVVCNIQQVKYLLLVYEFAAVTGKECNTRAMPIDGINSKGYA